MKFKDKAVLHCFRDAKHCFRDVKQGFTPGIRYCVLLTCNFLSKHENVA